MTLEEESGWIDFFRIKAEDEERAMREAKSGRGGGGIEMTRFRGAG
jgi:hypothetical protein